MFTWFIVIYRYVGLQMVLRPYARGHSSSHLAVAAPCVTISDNNARQRRVWPARTGNRLFTAPGLSQCNGGPGAWFPLIFPNVSENGSLLKDEKILTTSNQTLLSGWSPYGCRGTAVHLFNVSECVTMTWKRPLHPNNGPLLTGSMCAQKDSFMNQNMWDCSKFIRAHLKVLNCIKNCIIIIYCTLNERIKMVKRSWMHSCYKI